MRLVHRITLAILATVLLVVGLVGVSLYLSVERGFSQYVIGVEVARLDPGVARLAEYYEREHSWSGLASDEHLFRRLLHRDADEGPPPFERPRPPPGLPPPPDHDPIDLLPRVTLYDAGHTRIIGRSAWGSDTSTVPILVNGENVGWLGVEAHHRFKPELDLRYLEQVRTQLVAITLGALVVGLISGWLLTRKLLTPIQKLGAGTHRLTAGDYEARLDPTSTDELGQLASAFNVLAERLGSDQASRRQWVADTSHELRTPVTILVAEVDALIDGVRPVTPQALESLRAELNRLSKLIADLEELARSDRGELHLHRTRVHPVALFRNVASLFQARCAARALRLQLPSGENDPVVLADADRLDQVFTNLLENSVRYTGDGGEIRIRASQHDGSLILVIEDSAPGAPESALPHLFERFYRADVSRSREHGGSGLGLAICKQIIRAHGGSIAAAPSPLGGLRIEIRLSLSGAS